MEVTPAPVRIPTRRPLVPSFTSVVGLARTFHLALVNYTIIIFSILIDVYYSFNHSSPNIGMYLSTTLIAPINFKVYKNNFQSTIFKVDDKV